MDDGNMVGRFPAIIKSYDPKKRTCRVDIPAINTGGDVLSEAEIEYPIGDKSRAGKWGSEIEFLEGDSVWVDFIGGDPRYPVITGFRNPQAGNSIDWRRWHHKNIDFESDELFQTKAGTDYRVGAKNRGQVISGGRLLLRSNDSVMIQAGGSVIIKSANGTRVF
jgi:hypothetical protein